MDSAYLVTDDQLKEHVNTAMQHQLQELAAREGNPMRDADYVNFIEEHTGVIYPITTWQQYRKGLRMRLPFLLLMSYLFKRSIASFFGADLAREDYRLAANMRSFVLDDFTTGDVAMTIPREMAQTMHLLPGAAKVLQVTKANNANPDLRLGVLAIIDTNYTKISLSGTYLIKKGGAPVFAGITANGTGGDIVLRFDTTKRKLTAAGHAKLEVLGRVVDTLG